MNMQCGSIVFLVLEGEGFCTKRGWRMFAEKQIPCGLANGKMVHFDYAFGGFQ